MATSVRKEVVTCRVISTKTFQEINYSVSIHASLKIHDIPSSHCMACVDETPKKIVGSTLICFLCGCTLNKERVPLFGKSSVDIQCLIKAAIDVDVTFFLLSEIFICTANCYRCLTCFEKISNNLCNVKKRISSKGWNQCCEVV